MAEEATIGWRMVGGKRHLFIRGMALFAKPFRLLFVHGHEGLMVLVVGQGLGGFGRRIEQQAHDDKTNHKEQAIGKQFFLVTGHRAR